MTRMGSNWDSDGGTRMAGLGWRDSDGGTRMAGLGWARLGWAGALQALALLSSVAASARVFPSLSESV